MEPWRKVFREGLCPQLSVPALEALEKGLRTDDANLIQGATTSPPPLEACREFPVEACCLMAYPGWKTGLQTVAEVEAYFGELTDGIDKRIGEPASSRWLTNFFDDTPREEMRAVLLPEVQAELAKRLTPEDR